MYSTTKSLADPRSWTPQQPFYPTIPASVKDTKGNAAWLDFWNICDDKKCHLAVAVRVSPVQPLETSQRKVTRKDAPSLPLAAAGAAVVLAPLPAP